MTVRRTEHSSLALVLCSMFVSCADAPDEANVASVEAASLYDEEITAAVEGSIRPSTSWPGPRNDKGRPLGYGSVTDDGAATYTVPIVAPPGLAGLEPNITLEYNSRAPNGMLGVGWSISGFSQIARCGKSFVYDRRDSEGEPQRDGVAFADNDAICLDGERLLPVASGTASAGSTDVTEYRSVRDGSARIDLHGRLGDSDSYFEVWRQDGRISTYGNTSNSRLVGPRLPNVNDVTLAWMISSTRDRSDNAIRYTYDNRGNGEAYPTNVRYTYKSHSSASPTLGPYLIQFEWERSERTDPVRKYVSGLLQQIRHRLLEVKVGGTWGQGTANAVQIRSYRFTYRQDVPGAMSRSYLTRIEERAFPWQSGETRSIQFDYGSSSPSDYTWIASSTSVFSVPDELGNRSPQRLIPAKGLIYQEQNDVLIWRHSRGLAAQTIVVSDGGSQVSPFPYLTDKHLIPFDHNYDGTTDFLTYRVDQYNRYASIGLEQVVWGGRNGYGLEPIGPALQTVSNRGVSGVVVADLDGNGVSDLFINDNTQSHYFQNDGSFAKYVRTEHPIPDASLKSSLVADINGDGKHEILYSESDGRTWIAGRDRFGNWYTSPYYALPGLQDRLDPVCRHLPDQCRAVSPINNNVLADVNGDGLKDLLTFRGEGFAKLHTIDRIRKARIGGPSFEVRINTGSGFLAPYEGVAPTAITVPGYNTVTANDVRVADINGDGNEDLVLLLDIIVNEGSSTSNSAFTRTMVVHLSDGEYYHPRVISISPRRIEPRYVDGVVTGLSNDWLERVDWHFAFLQLDDDSAPEIVYGARNGENVDYYKIDFAREEVGLLRRVQSDFSATATEPRPADVTFEYTRAAYARTEPRPSRATCVYPLRCDHDDLIVVERHTDSSGIAYQHRYERPRGDLRDGRWLGFGKHVVIDEAVPDERTIIEFDNDVVGVRGDYPFAFLPKRTETRKHGRTLSPSNGTTFSDTTFERVVTNVYVEVPVGGENNVVVRPDSEITEEFLGLATDDSTYRTRRRFLYDNFGTVRQVLIDYGGATAEVITYTPEHRPAAHLFGLIRTITQTARDDNGKSIGSRRYTFEYDDRGLVSSYTKLGQLHGVVERDSSGQIKAVRERPIGDTTREFERVTSYEYDAYGHVRQTTNPKGHTRYYGTNRLGLPAIEIDENGIRTRLEYDSLGRPRFVSKGGEELRISYEEGQTNDARFITTYTSNTGRWKRVVSDWHGRVRQERSRILVSGGVGEAVTSRTYDRYGRLSQLLEPAFDGDKPVSNLFFYDPLDRPILSTRQSSDPKRPSDRSVETLRWSYDGRREVFWNARGHQAETRMDRRGRPTIRMEQTDEGLRKQVMTFEYAGFDLVRAMTDQNGDRWTYNWTDAGLLRSADGPNPGDDRHYSYNGFGELESVWTVDPELQPKDLIFRHQRDALGRVTGTYSPEDGWVNFEWDTAQNGVGRLSFSHRVQDGVRKSFLYDAAGRVRRETHQISSRTYDVDYAYDSLGRLRDVQYPRVGADARVRVRYLYDPGSGFLKSIVDPTTTGVPIWEAQQYGPDGKIEAEAFENRVGSVKVRDGFGRLESLWIARAGSWLPLTLERIEYAYNQNGSVTRRASERTKSGDAITYDALDRIKSWSQLFRDGRPQMGVVYEYDSRGNMVGRSGRSQQFAAGSNQITSTNTSGQHHSFEHDDRGRRTTGVGWRATFTGFNLPRTLIGSGAVPTVFKYDGEGNRAEKIAPDVTTAYVSDLYECDRSASVERHVFKIRNGAREVAQIIKTHPANSPNSGVTTQKRYLHDDHQGSVVMVTDGAGDVSSFFRYEPFGLPLLPSSSRNTPLASGGSVDIGYTGHEHDDEFRLIHMRGRTYDPFTGTFLTPDPVVADPLSRQTWNHYSYVNNNPVTLIDPSGFQGHCDGWACPAQRPSGPDIYFSWGPGGNDGNGGRGSGGDSSGTPSFAPISPPSPVPEHRRNLPTIEDSRGSGSGTVPTIGPMSPMTPGRLDRTDYGFFEPFPFPEFLDASTPHTRTKILNTWDLLQFFLPPQVDNPHGIRLANFIPGIGVAARLVQIARWRAFFIPSSRVLARSLLAAGHVRAAGVHAHHIVAGSARLADNARRILLKYGVGINESANGVFLPAAQHRKIHTEAYYNAVDSALRRAKSRDDVIEILGAIREKILLGTFP